MERRKNAAWLRALEEEKRWRWLYADPRPLTGRLHEGNAPASRPGSAAPVAVHILHQVASQVIIYNDNDNDGRRRA